MHTTYHLSSAQDISTDILDAIKATFKSKPITIIVEDDNEPYTGITPEMKAILDERLQEDSATYISAEESIDKLRKKYEI